MRIQHNITAMNSYRNFSANNSNLSKNLEKLSSGYKINRAGDDAAGLAISEKMRAQITGIEGATKNSKDGISLIQTAEGALTEVHDMLNRMTTLAEQSANGTYQNELDREQLQKEVGQLKEEIDRIADSTNFNGLKLLDGSLETGAKTGVGSISVDLSKLTGNMLSGVSYVDATKGTFMSGDIGDITVSGKEGDKYDFSFEYTDNDGKHQKTSVSFTLAKAEGQTTFGTTDGDVALKASDGSMYVINSAAAATGAKADIADAIVAELSKNADFSANFKVQQSTAAAGAKQGTLTFAAVNAGENGAALEKMAKTITTTGGSYTHTAISVAVGQSQLKAAVTGTDGTSTAINSFKTIDVSKAKVWDGTEDTLEDAIFEINNQKFVFTSVTEANLTAAQKAMLSDAGIGNNYVAGVDSAAPDNADATEMTKKIAAATGLKTEQGTVTVGTTNTWAAAATAGNTMIALKDNVSSGSSISGGLKLQIGDTADSYNKLTVSIGDMHSKSIGIGDVDISTQDGAAEALDKIKTAINNVSDTRGTLGSLQNRLEHTINNLGVQRENIQNAESLIRDTDVAEEMMAYTKNNILNQSAQAMLAQANQLPQGVLQLLG